MKVKNIVIITIVVILLFIALGTLYVNRYIFPVKIKALIENTIKEKTGYPISIGKMSYLPPAQVRFNDIALYKKKSPKEPLVKIDELLINPQLWTFLKNKAIAAKLNLNNLSFNGIHLTGTTSLSLKPRTSNAKRLLLKDRDGMIRFSNFLLKSDKLPAPLTEINGIVSLKDDTLKLNNASIRYKDLLLHLKGALRGLDNGEYYGTASASSDILETEGQFMLRGDQIEVKALKGTLYGSPFSILGDIKGLSNPDMNLYGESQIELERFTKLASGSCSLAFFLNGKINNLKGQEGSVKLSSKRCKVRDIDIENLYLDLRLSQGILNSHRLEANIYDGILNASMNMDIKERDLPYSLDLVLKDMDLEYLAHERGIKKRLSGYLSSKFSFKGIARAGDTLRGNGWATITDGYLWEIPVLKGLTTALGMSNLRTVVFREAAGNFLVKERRVSTDDLTLYSENVNMTAKGAVDFNGNIDLKLNTNITQDLVKGSSEGARIANLIISQAGNYMGNIKVTGTLKDPKYKLGAGASKRDIIKGGLEEIFKKEAKEFLGDILR